MQEPIATRAVTGSGEISADDLLTADIPVSKKGYTPEVVDALLERAAGTIERLAVLDDPALEHRRREQADLMQRALMLAEVGADEAIREAQTMANAIQEDAELRARRLVEDAQQVAVDLVETERARAHCIIREGLARRHALEGDVTALEHFATQARRRLRQAFETESAALDRLLADVNGRPALHDVDLTEPIGSGAGPMPESSSVTWPPPATVALPAQITSRGDGAASAVIVLDSEDGT